MKIQECIEKVSTFMDLKRVATEYVIDFRRLNCDELKAAMIKTLPQYENESNIRSVVKFFELNPDRKARVLFSVMLEILLNCDDFTATQRSTEDQVILYEQDVVNQANEIQLNAEVDHLDFYKYVVEAAWEHNDDISVDEQNLINKIRRKLNISSKNHQILEAQLGKFPTENNVIHTKDEIADVRRLLQSKGLLFSVRDTNNVDYDVIPEEIATCLRNIFGIDIKASSFANLADSKFIRNKKYMTDILTKAGVSLPSIINLTQLKALCLKHLTAHQLIGGFSPMDGLDKTALSDWCSSLGLTPYGTKLELIDRIITYYDSIKQIKHTEEDDREVYYQYFDEFARRDLAALRSIGLIDKDLECERKFEQATNYIFEVIFRDKPLMMSGTEHPDGILSYNDKLIMWDNKSKETPVNLADHTKQFERYINNSSKHVAVFIVIAPDFTLDSAKECMRFSMNSDTLMLLITAKELKALAEQWKAKYGNTEDSLPLGVFKQSGRFNSDMVSF